jgi:nicotinamide-nucleotide amidase
VNGGATGGPAAGMAAGMAAGRVIDTAAGTTAGRVIGLLVASGHTVGTAESLTGGLVAAALTTVPGASAVFRGGIVAYAADLKASLLGVPVELLARVGTVHKDVAVAMASGAAHRLGSTVGVATTGVAGPDPADGQPVGTVHVAVSVQMGGAPVARVSHLALALAGDRETIRRDTVNHALKLLISAVLEDIE